MWAVGCIFAELLTLKPLFQGVEVKVAPNPFQVSNYIYYTHSAGNRKNLFYFETVATIKLEFCLDFFLFFTFNIPEVDTVVLSDVAIISCSLINLTRYLRSWV